MPEVQAVALLEEAGRYVLRLAGAHSRPDHPRAA
jgi:hypothetical protein